MVSPHVPLTPVRGTHQFITPLQARILCASNLILQVVLHLGITVSYDAFQRNITIQGYAGAWESLSNIDELVGKILKAVGTWRSNTTVY